MASQIVVINDDGKGGRVFERGSHEELMQLDSHYARLFSLQATGYQWAFARAQAANWSAARRFPTTKEPV